MALEVLMLLSSPMVVCHRFNSFQLTPQKYYIFFILPNLPRIYFIFLHFSPLNPKQ